MAAVVVFILVLFVAVKTFSYGIWEVKRRNEAGGIFVIALALTD